MAATLRKRGFIRGEVLQGLCFMVCLSTRTLICRFVEADDYGRVSLIVEQLIFTIY